MQEKEILEKTADFVKSQMKEDATGHDWWHIERVCKTALVLAEKEKADFFISQMTALLHDLDDWKSTLSLEKALLLLRQKTCTRKVFDAPFSKKVRTQRNYNTDEPVKAKEFLIKLNLDEEVISQIMENIKDISFKGSGVDTKPRTKEAVIVQDADRLDAIGAIGIARCFATGAKIFGNPIHDPELKPQQHKSFEEYKKSKTTSINHFYEKLLLIKDRMNTESARKIAEERHKFMEEFLERFLQEWEGKK